MNKDFWDKLTLRLFGTVGQQTLLGKAIYYSAYGLCTYCAILRGVMIGVGLALYTHLNVPAAILGTVFIFAAVILTQIERSAQ
jgi:hypothetical protein